MRAAALAYRARDWSVIPVEARGKRPLVAWREFQQRLATRGEIDAWFERWPHANIGIVTGRVSGIVVIDVDPRHGGLESVARWERVQGPFPPTVQAATGGGGHHLYFAHPGTVLSNRVAVRPGVDLRGDGGCVVAPPSVHPNGRRYAWSPGHAPDDLPLAPLPPWFGAVARVPAQSAHGRTHWRRLVREGVDEGQRNATLASLTGHLLRRGVDPDVALELILAWNRVHCRPPLADAEAARVVQSIARLHEREFDGAEPG